MPLVKRSFFLSDKKRELLQAALRAKGIDAEPNGRIEPGVLSGPIPLSFAQQRLWVIHQVEPESPAYNFPASVRFRGKLDVAVLENALNEIVRRHAMLRTTFSEVNGSPAQMIAPELHVSLPCVDFRGISHSVQKIALETLVERDVLEPFDLEHGPLLRLKLAQLGDDEHVLIITFHHIVSDGWAFSIFVRELGQIYEAFSQGKSSPLPELEIQYADFARWQREWKEKQTDPAHLAYWKAKLAEVPQVMELPTDRPRPAAPTYRGVRHFFTLPKALTESLRELGSREGATLYMTLLAGLNVMLHRYTGRQDIVVGSPVASRNRSEIEGLIGFFLNMLVLRNDLSGSPNFKDVVKRVRATALEAFEHQETPFEQLVEELQPKRELNVSPLFQVMFVLQSRAMAPIQLGNLSLAPESVNRPASVCDLTFQLAETDEGLDGFIEYSTDLFDERTIVQMAAHLQAILTALCAQPERNVSEIPYLSHVETRQIIVDWNPSRPDKIPDRTITELIEAQVECSPDSVAIAHGSQSLTYRELNARANRLANHLRRLGVGPEVLVAICQTRSLDMVISILAVLKAGGAYVPLDPAYPRERLQVVLNDSQARVVLTEQKLLAEISDGKRFVVCQESIASLLREESAENLDRLATPANLSYVIYTSGSTGRPKGVAIEHRRASAFVQWAISTFSREELSGVFFCTSICFDLSIFEIFAPLASGGTILLAANALELNEVAAKHRVTLLNTVPSAMRELLRTNAVPDSVRTVNLAGEALPGSLVESIYASTSVERVYNLYGPTEDTTYSSGAVIESDACGEPPIGRPLTDKSLYILDSRLQPVPVGVCGELYIAGSGLARGYLGRPELTAERFVPNPFSTAPGERMYRTGDIARFLPDGNVAYLGRADHQVKIRGFRIELGEIEAVVSRHPAIGTCVVTVHTDAYGAKELVLHAARKSGACDSSELRRFLSSRVPAYMIPSTINVLDAMPLTPNGKIDRRALHDSMRTQQAIIADDPAMPRNALEHGLFEIWKNLLNKKQFGIHDNFFEIGGHSLLATQVISRIRRDYSVELPIRSIFEAPTIAGLGALIQAKQAEEISPDDLAAMLSEIEKISDHDAAALLRQSPEAFVS